MKKESIGYEWNCLFVFSFSVSIVIASEKRTGAL